MGLSHLSDSMEDSLVIDIYELLKDTYYTYYDVMTYDMFEQYEDVIQRMKKVVE